MFVRLFAILIVIALLGLLAVFVTDKADDARADLPVLKEIGPFEFVQHNGARFTLEDLRGRINIVDFIFTRCQGPCPIMSGNMAELYELYSDHDRIRFVSITVDPEYDSLDILQTYARDQGVTDDRWIFLHAPLNEVKRISEADFMLAADDLPAGHSTRFVLVDDQARIRGHYNGVDDASIEVLKTHIRELIRLAP